VAKYLKFVVLVYLVFLVLATKLPLWLNPTKKSHGISSGLHGGHCCSSMPNPAIAKMVFKPHKSRKCNMWWCFILHEVQSYAIFPLRNNE
jgi:hypothetical protein